MDGMGILKAIDELGTTIVRYEARIRELEHELEQALATVTPPPADPVNDRV